MLNGFAINSGVINGSGVIAQYAYLPTTNAYLNFSISENQVALLSATTSIATDAAGYITKVAQISAATDAATVSVYGDLTISHAIQINATGAVSVDAVGTVSRLTLIPSMQDGVVFGESASMLLTGGLSATGEIEFGGDRSMTVRQQMSTVDALAVDAFGALSWQSSPVASETLEFGSVASLSAGHLTAIPSATDMIFLEASTPSLQSLMRMSTSEAILFESLAYLSIGLVRPLPLAQEWIDISATAVLTMTGRLQAEESVSITDDAALSRRIMLLAEDQFSIEQSGALANNASSHDPEQFTFIRPYNERTWVRT